MHAGATARPRPGPAIGWLLAAALLLHYVLLRPAVSSGHGDFDALHLYFPLARGLAASGIAFFADPLSVQAPPFSFIYPALFGTSLPAIKLANAVLSGFTLLLVFRAAWLMHSPAAGVVAAFLFALSPTLRPHLATPVTEGPYLFLTAAWFCGFAEWLVNRRRAALVASAIAVALAALPRAPLFYAIVLMVVVAAAFAWRGRGEPRARAREALLAYGAALLPIVAFIAKNAWLFGLPFFTTGGANALYLGNNPLTGGFDPNYLGLYFDVGAIARDQSHLTLEAERLLGAAAREILAERDWAFLAHLHLRKLAAFVFVTGAEPDAVWLRAGRIVTLVFAWGSLPRRGEPLRAVLWAMLAYQLAVHAPVLYTHRYSVDALDLWLTLAAAVGLCTWVSEARGLRVAGAVVVAAAGVGVGATLLGETNRAMPDVFAVPRLQIWRSGASARLEHGAPPVELPMAAPLYSPYSNHVLVADVVSGTANGFGCDRLTVTFRPDASMDWSPAVEFVLRPDGVRRRYQFGGVPLRLSTSGTLRLSARCGEGSSATVERLAIYAARGAEDYRARVLGEPRPSPIDP
jgi:hypothetical protein